MSLLEQARNEADAASREILRLTEQLEASRAAHARILAVSNGQADELIAMGAALQAATSQVAGAEGEAKFEGERRMQLASLIGDFVANVAGEREPIPSTGRGRRLILLTQFEWDEQLSRAFQNGTEKVRIHTTAAHSRTGEPLLPAILRCIRSSADPEAEQIADQLAELSPDAALLKW